MSSVKLLLNKDRILKDGSYPLVFQIIHNRRKKLIYTSFGVSMNEFDVEKGKLIYISDVVRHLKEVRSINRSLAKQRLSIESHISELEQRSADFSVDDIIARYKVEYNPLSLLHYMDMQIELKKDLHKEGTLAAYRSTRVSVASYIGHKEIKINDVTSSFLRNYEQYLQRRGVSDNTICFYFRNIKSMYNQAIVDGYCPAEENPFRNLRAKPRKTTKRAVDSALIQRIASLDLTKKPHLDIARDMAVEVLLNLEEFSGAEIVLRGMRGRDVSFIPITTVAGKSILRKVLRTLVKHKYITLKVKIPPTYLLLKKPADITLQELVTLFHGNICIGEAYDHNLARGIEKLSSPSHRLFCKFEADLRMIISEKLLATSLVDFVSKN